MNAMAAIETWKPVDGWVDFYEVSDLGRVRSLPREIEASNNYGTHIRHIKGRIIRPHFDFTGYVKFGAHREGRNVKLAVSQVVLTAFCGPNPGGMEARHKNKDMRDNRATNLYWGKLVPRKHDKNRAEKHTQYLTEKQVQILQNFGLRSQRNTAKVLGVTPTMVRRVWQAYAPTGGNHASETT